MKRLASEIYDAVKLGKLLEPFTAQDVKKACPGWAVATYGTFLPKHRVGNPGGNTALFRQVGSALYECL
ncbi:protein of unknown function [Nitrospira japonica]|uniref:Uncharacterized protein n=1 Tax=Nitrospira japonica TaxID=1325564 RepID=A0A1W1I1D1_9BACT|nr:protein of unknown function [Nitrospira japonica]